MARLQEPTAQPPLEKLFFLGFAAVRATVILHAKLCALTSFEMPERPSKKSYSVSLSFVFGVQHQLVSLTSAKEHSTVNLDLAANKMLLGDDIFENIRLLKANKQVLKDCGWS